MSGEDIIKVAISQLGVKEDNGRNKDSNGRIAAYWEAAKHSQINTWLNRVPGVEHRDEWCAAFASWCYRQAGLEMVHRYGSGFPGCGMMIKWLADQDAWYDWQEADPKPGDLVFFDWQRLPRQLKSDVSITWRRAHDVVDHVGLVDERIVENCELVGVRTIEGNWNSGVSRATRLFSEHKVIGFGCLID